jgi:hypothetical protein
MKLYSKEINGELVIKPAVEIGMAVNGVTMYFPPEAMLLQDGWSVYMEDIEELKQKLIESIKNYDISDNVNVFYLNNKPMWLSKDTRVGLKLRFETEIKNGQEETTLWYDNQLYILSVDTAMQILYALELYASKCYDTTQYHIKTVTELQTVEEIKSYDITHGYPEKLYFNT